VTPEVHACVIPIARAAIKTPQVVLVVLGVPHNSSVKVIIILTPVATMTKHVKAVARPIRHARNVLAILPVGGVEKP